MVAPMIVMLAAIFTTGGVIIFRPLTRRLGDLLQVMAQQRREIPPQEMERLRELLSSVEARLALLEERQNFTEALLADQRPRGMSLPSHGDRLAEPLPPPPGG